MKIKLWHLLIAIFLLVLFLKSSGFNLFYEVLYPLREVSVSQFYFANPILLKPEKLLAIFTIKYRTQPSWQVLPFASVICIDGNCYERGPWIVPVYSSRYYSRERTYRISVDTSNLDKGFHIAEVYVISLQEGYYKNPRYCYTSARVWDIVRKEWEPYFKEPQKKCMPLDEALKKIDWIKIAKDAKEHKLKLKNVFVWYSKPFKFLVCEGSINKEGCGITKYVTKTEKIDCRITGCPEGYECSKLNDDWVCKQKPQMVLPIFIIVFLLIILGLVIWWLKKMNKHDWILLSGIIVFLLLIKMKGMPWAVEQLAIFYVAITVFNWIKEKLKEEENA